jgi:hypothetical protein
MVPDARGKEGRSHDCCYVLCTPRARFKLVVARL